MRLFWELMLVEMQVMKLLEKETYLSSLVSYESKQESDILMSLYINIKIFYINTTIFIAGSLYSSTQGREGKLGFK